MLPFSFRLVIFALAFSLAALPNAAAEGPAESPSSMTIDFGSDIRPILSDNCFFCHGPDANTRHADLRLDTHEGLSSVIAEDPEDSLLYQRISADDADLLMPPADSHKRLTDEQIGQIAHWIQQGASVETHWSFRPLQGIDHSLPADALPSQVVDFWIDRQLRRLQLPASPAADRVTLIRRIHFDLTGLPPEPTVVADFISETSELAYENLVDQLLDSPHFGERMAVWWLDLVRYADTVGYHGDQEVSVWPFRDYVIESFNSNKPFDQFTREQLAGDLIANELSAEAPKADEKLVHQIASGYNRLGMMSAEGGVQDKEYLAKYIAERVRNVSGTWLGVTMGCCECHDHKFDPFSSQEFYQMEAFFADIKERGLYAGANADGNWGPSIRLPSEEQRKKLEVLTNEISELESAMAKPTGPLADQLRAAQTTWEQQLVQQLAKADEDEPTSGDQADEDSGEKAKIELPPDIAAIVVIPTDERSDEQQKQLAAHFRSITDLLDQERQELSRLKKSLADLEAQIPTTLITESVPPRPVRVLPRGNWMDDSGELVEPGFPVALSMGAPSPVDSHRLNRLDLADWIVSEENPLTSRVLVNRIWKLFFGEGLSRTLDDLGAQGEPPSHPELLDFLAVELIESGWNIKQLVRTIVLSQAYQRSSLTSAEVLQADPHNRWLARQSRFRLEAEFVRDNALAVSGLLAPQIGGPSVKPYQPPGYWAYLNFPTREWKNGTGEDLYRRGLYTHWQRQYLHPSLLAFDAPGREECTANRPRSNTPLQALALLNDPSYVEAARAFAAELLLKHGNAEDAILDEAFRKALSRNITDEEAQILKDLLQQARGEYAETPEAASDILQVGEWPIPEGINSAELAAWIAVTRTILSLPEFFTRY